MGEAPTKSASDEPPQPSPREGLRAVWRLAGHERWSFVGAMVALGNATTTLEQVIGFAGVLLAAGNAVGGYVVTERMLEMFKSTGGGGGKKGMH